MGVLIELEFIYLTALIIEMNWSKIYSLSFGPGDDSEWYCMPMAGIDLCLIPSIVLSFALTWVMETSYGYVDSSIAYTWF